MPGGIWRRQVDKISRRNGTACQSFDLRKFPPIWNMATENPTTNSSLGNRHIGSEILLTQPSFQQEITELHDV